MLTIIDSLAADPAISEIYVRATGDLLCVRQVDTYLYELVLMRCWDEEILASSEHPALLADIIEFAKSI